MVPLLVTCCYINLNLNYDPFRGTKDPGFVHYTPDGSGRDFFIISNNGGL